MPPSAASLLPNPNNRGPYHFRGAAAALFYDCSPEVLLSGPAGTGKSLACLAKMHTLAMHAPGFRGLIVRKTRESLTEAALVTFEKNVVPEDCAIFATGGQRKMRQAYTYSNGSTIVVGGMDKAGKVMSTEYDVIYVQEAIELTEDDWESLTTRCRDLRQPPALAYQQLIADTNPDKPTHWLKRRCDAGKTRLYESRHEDNATLWDTPAGAWTDAGTAYLAKLNALTGARLQRLRYGRWVQAEGVVYEGWDAAIHVVDRFPIPNHWPRIWSVDFGFTNPFVCQFWTIDDDGRLFLYREIYHTKRLVEDHAKRILAVARAEPVPVAIICDHDAEDRATLERHLGMPTSLALKAKRAGIQAVGARLKKAGDGKPRVFVMRDSLDERDHDLDERKLPCQLTEEIDGYVWDPRRGGEEPLDKDNHSMDALRYAVWTIDADEVPGGAETNTVLRP